MARSVILLDAPAEMMVANGELPKRIHSFFAAQARIAGAAKVRNPATAPIPKANAGLYERFIVVSDSLDSWYNTPRFCDSPTPWEFLVAEQALRLYRGYV
jgi:hypothetical protein